MYETQERAKRITDIHVLWGQSTVIEELIQAGKIDEEYLYPFNGDEVLEWWLVTPWLAERLKEQGEIIIDELGCRWWGRLTSGQAIYMGRRNNKKSAGQRLTQLTTNKVRFHTPDYWIETLFSRTLHNKSAANFHRVFCLLETFSIFVSLPNR